MPCNTIRYPFVVIKETDLIHGNNYKNICNLWQMILKEAGNYIYEKNIPNLSD